MLFRKRVSSDTSERCVMPPRQGSKVPRFYSLPENMIGCRLAAHGNSSARIPAKDDANRKSTALSFHAVSSNGIPAKRALFNIGAPVVFHNASLYVDQRAAEESARNEKNQVRMWPDKTMCQTDTDCWGYNRDNPSKGEVCPPSKGTGERYCSSYRRVKTPMGYVIGEVAPDDGQSRAVPVALFVGACRRWNTEDGKRRACAEWIPARFVDARCMKKGDPTSCPTIEKAVSVRFAPNYNDSLPGLPKHRPVNEKPFTVGADLGRAKARKR